MRRGLLRAVVTALALAAPAVAQHAGGAGGDVPDVPSGPAAIRGRVVHAGRPEAVDGIEVVLYALPQGAPPGLRKARTKQGGGFAFENVSNDPSTAYLVGARVGEVPFPGEKVIFSAGELQREVEIRIAEPTLDAKAIRVGDVKLRLDWVGGRLLLTESHRLHNASDRVFFVPAAQRAGRSPGFRTGLPDGAAGLTGPLGILPEGLQKRGNEIVFFGPIYPGEQELTFAYEIPAADGKADLHKRFPDGAEHASVLVSEGGPSVSAPGLEAGEPATLDGRSYRTFTSRKLRPGAQLALDVKLPAAQSDLAALAVKEVRAFLEQDAAALTVREEHQLSVSGDRVLVAPGDAALYHIDLLDDARDVRFATDPPGIALAPGAAGGIDVAGPLPAGDSTIELLYHVPVTDGRGEVTLSSSRAVPLLSIFVADTGLDIHSDRLHRRRPVRSQDRTYLNLEAFEVEPGEKVQLTLTSIESGGATGTTLAWIAAVVGAAAITALLLAPLRPTPSSAEEASSADDTGAPGERESLYAAMRDLEEDFETGKLSAPDHELMHEELRVRALALLQREREEKRERPLAAVPETAAATCARCGAERREQDRFCGQCGAAFAPASAPSREASA